MAVRAKFTVQYVKRMRTYNNAPGRRVGYEVQLTPVTGGSEEDKAFWEATPNGEIKMSVLNSAAGEQFEPGDTYYIDFTKAEG